MKKLPIFLFAVGLLVSCSNSNKTDNKDNSSMFVEVKETDSPGGVQPDTTAIIELMEYYQDLDSIETNKRFETYRNLVERRDGYKQEDIDWYFKNINHIDSISKQAVILTRQEQYEDLGYLLDAELGNYYSHPNSDSYSIYELSLMMVPLYRKISPDSQAYYDKLIEMWEMNRFMMEAVQIQTGDPHPYYERMMFELSILYDKAGMKEKKNEIESILDSIDFN